MENKPQTSLTNKMLQIWGRMTQSSSGLLDKSYTKSWFHFRLKNTFLQDKARYLSMMRNLEGSKPLQDKHSRRLRQRRLGIALQGKGCTFGAALSNAIQLGI